MATINGFCSFYQDMSSLYWQRICSLMAEKSTKEKISEEGYFSEDTALVVSKSGSFSKKGDCFCVFAGSITNAKTVKEKLSDMGESSAESFSDIFISVYKTMGVRGAAILFGEFSAALWDCSKKKLFVFRDKSGTYPLYYACINERFAFSSSVNSILRFPGVYPVVTERSLADLFCCCGRINPSQTPFESIKRVPAGCVAEFSEKGVRIKSYYTLNPGDKFNSEFIVRDAIRVREGEAISCKKEISDLQKIFSLLNVVDYFGFPVYPPVYFVMAILKEQKAEKIHIPYLPPVTKAPDLSFLLKEECLYGVDKDTWEIDSNAKYARDMNVYFDDEMKLRAAGRHKLEIQTQYALWGEVLERFGEMEGKEIKLPLADARFLECVTDGGGKDYIYKGSVFIPDCNFVRNILLNELCHGKRPVFLFIDREKAMDFINSSTDSLSLMYLLAMDYWSLRYKIELDLIR